MSRRRLLFSLALAGFAAGLTEGVARLALVVLDLHLDLAFESVPVEDLHQRHRDEIERLLAGDQGALAFDSELGWDLTPGVETEHFRIDAFGVRTDESFEIPTPPGVFRVALCGDSFSFGADVVTPYTLAETLMRLQPGLEVVNLAVPAYGPDQAWLRCRRMMERWEPDLVLIGFIADNAGRVVNTFRPFYFFRSGMAMGKPRFVLQRDGRLELMPNPLPSRDAYRELLDRPQEVLPRLGRHDFHYRSKPRPSRWDDLGIVRLVRLALWRLLPDEPMWKGEVLHPHGEPLRVSEAVLAGFANEVQAAGIPAVIVLMPSRFDITRDRDGKTSAYHHLGPLLQARGLRVVDLLDGFRELAFEVPPGRLIRVHYTRAGNGVAARFLLTRLEEQGLLLQWSATEREALTTRVRERLGRLPSVARLSAEERAALDQEIGAGSTQPQ